MAIYVKPLAEMNRESLAFLASNTDGRITLLSPGSIARALVESANRTADSVFAALDANLAGAYLSQATGSRLDLLAEMFGVRRRGATTALVSQSDNALRFYVTSGTLYDRLPDPTNRNRGLLPAGTQVYNQDASVAYTVVEDTYFPRSAKEVFVAARASATGPSHNVGAFVLTRHNLDDSSIRVTNPTSIQTALAAESDGELRIRISQLVLARQGGNETAVRLASLSAPGVADVQIVPNFAGAGSFDVMLIPTGNRVAVETILIANRNIREIVPLGMFYRVREPDYLRFSLVVTLRFAPKVFEAAKDLVRVNVERAILDYFGTIGLGGEMVITALGAAIRAADPGVDDYTIDALCISGRPQLLSNHRLNPDQLWLPDENLTDPVRVL